MAINMTETLRDAWLRIISMKSPNLRKSEKIEQLKEDFDIVIDGKKELIGLTELAMMMTEEYRKTFELETYLDSKFRQQSFAYAECLENTIKKIFSNHKEIEGKAEKICSRTIRLPMDGRRVRKYEKQMSLMIHELENLFHELDDEILKLEEILRKMQGLWWLLQDLLGKEIKCSLFASNIRGMEHLRAGKSCCDINGKYLKGFYNLGELMVLGMGTLEESIGITDISVSGYIDSKGKNGIQLRSSSPFYYKLLGEPEENKVTNAELMPGNLYELSFETSLKKISMQISVR